MNSTKIIDMTPVEQENSKSQAEEEAPLATKKHSSESDENASNLATINDLSADLGENSTTLSSIQSNPHTPEKGISNKA